MTNLEGRVLLRERVADAPAGPRGDLAILRDLATRLGEPGVAPSDAPEDVFEEIRRATRGARADYSGITYARLRGGEQLHWPVPDETHPGTPALFAERFAFPDGRARFVAVAAESDVEAHDAAFPLTLTTGRVREHYLSGTQTRRVARLLAAVPDPIVELHPSLAARFGIANGDLVRITSRRGSVDLAAKLSNDIRAETLFASFHWGGTQTLNDLTDTAVDPVSAMPGFKSAAVRIAKVSTTV
jgi:assimilatory nitrate reductase catalytic subunit